MRLRKTELFGAATIVSGSLLLVSACSGGDDYPSYTSTGGATNTGTGGTGTATGGTPSATGGTPSATGGVPAGTGGTTGGVPSTTGGVPSNTGGFTGGTTASTGGSTNTGGSIFGGGGKSTGGSSTGGFSNTGGKSGSTGGSGGGGTVTFAQVASVISARCSRCHGSGSLNLSTSGSTLYTTLTSTNVSRCGNNRFVTPNDTSKSALVLVTSGQCGTLRMPQGCNNNSMCLTTTEQATITNWIQSGAKGP